MSPSPIPPHIDLAHEPDFRLGDLKVRPSVRGTVIAGREETLEPRVMQVLIALARANGEVVSRDDLIRQCWGGRVVGDDAIHRCISRLRRLGKAGGGFAIETIPRVGYRLAAETAGKPATPEPPIPELPAKPAYAKPIFRMLALLALALAIAVALVWWRRASPPAQTAAAPSGRVAVQPFETLSGAGDMRYFGKAAAERILVVLSENQVLTVRKPGGETGRGADFVLTGTVQGRNGALRCIVHLTHAATRAELWTGSFDQAQAAAPQFQTRIATTVADQVRAAIRAGRTGAVGDAALAAYLRAQENARIGGKEATMKRLARMREVIAQAPDFSLGLSGYAVSAAQMLHYALPEERDRLRRDARQAARRALTRDPGNGEAYLALALTEETIAAEEAFYRKGLQVEADEPTLNSNLAALLQGVGRTGEALEYQRRAVVIEPLSPRKAEALARLLAQTGHPAEMRALITRTAAVWPNTPEILFSRFFLLLYNGYEREARAMLKTPAPGLDPVRVAALNAFAEAERKKGRSGDDRAIRQLRAAMAKMGVRACQTIVRALVRRDDRDAAFAMAHDIYFPDGATTATYVARNNNVLFAPDFAAMRRDPRFLPLIESLGLLRYWRETGSRPDVCRHEDIPLCRALTAPAGPGHSAGPA